MKKTVLYYFFAAQLLFSCQAAEQDNPLLVPTCMDGIKNQDENGIDCGGICNLCVITGNNFVVPCEASLKTDRVTVGDIELAFASGRYTTAPIGGTYKIAAEFADGDSYRRVTIHLYGEFLPKQNKAYILDVWKDLGPGKAYISYSGRGYPDKNTTTEFVAPKGYLYLVYQNGKPVVEICPVTLKSEYSGQTLTFTGKITCKI